MDSYAQQSSDPNQRLRDLEEKIRLLKDRLLLIGQSLVEEREKNFSLIQDIKREMIKTKDENQRMKELLERVTEQLNNVARKDELFIIQRQLDLIRK